MGSETANVVICGAGIAGISTAYHLALRGIKEILLVDERAPMSLTSDKSSECYRNWWPGPGDAMVSLMNHSIDLMERYAKQSGNIFHMNRRGYLYLSADPARIPAFIQSAQAPSELGAGRLRTHRGEPSDPAYMPSPSTGYQGIPSGADLLLSQDLIQTHFPYLPGNLTAALHVRRAGWFSAHQLGTYLLEQAKALGVRLVNQSVIGVEVHHNHIQAVQLSDGTNIKTGTFVNAAGPFVHKIGRLFGVDIPIYNELHLKVAFRDPLGVIPREAPLLIWSDPQELPWSDEEREWLAGEENMRKLLSIRPSGAHTRPEGGQDSDMILLLWQYDRHIADPVYPPKLDEMYPEIALRGMSAIFPGLAQYFERLPRPMLDGGYYTKTRENRPLIGGLPVEGAYILGALSGFGLMAGCGAGDLLAAQITGEAVPAFTDDFSIARYEDPAYQRLLENWPDQGQI
jgi:glycine/D-amino acid oxidase-like deaminating enzyme